MGASADATGGLDGLLASVGLAAGAGKSVHDALLTPPDVPQGSEEFTDGPQIGDNTTKRGQYGVPIPHMFGLVRTSGNIIWTSGVDKVSSSARYTVWWQGNRNLRSEFRERKSVSYLVSFAVALGKGPINRIRKIWANGSKVYDNSVGTLIPSKHCFGDFTLYTGTETQTADPLIQSHKGAASTPPFRGLAYVVFEDLDVSSYGGVIPDLSFEVAANGEETIDFKTLVSDTPGASNEDNHLQWDLPLYHSGGSRVSGELFTDDTYVYYLRSRTSGTVWRWNKFTGVFDDKRFDNTAFLNDPTVLRSSGDPTQFCQDSKGYLYYGNNDAYQDEKVFFDTNYHQTAVTGRITPTTLLTQDYAFMRLPVAYPSGDADFDSWGLIPIKINGFSGLLRNLIIMYGRALDFPQEAIIGSIIVDTDVMNINFSAITSYVFPPVSAWSLAANNLIVQQNPGFPETVNFLPKEIYSSSAHTPGSGAGIYLSIHMIPGIDGDVWVTWADPDPTDGRYIVARLKTMVEPRQITGLNTLGAGVFLRFQEMWDMSDIYFEADDDPTSRLMCNNYRGNPFNHGGFFDETTNSFIVGWRDRWHRFRPGEERESLSFGTDYTLWYSRSHTRKGGQCGYYLVPCSIYNWNTDPSDWEGNNDAWKKNYRWLKIRTTDFKVVKEYDIRDYVGTDPRPSSPENSPFPAIFWSTPTPEGVCFAAVGGATPLIWDHDTNAVYLGGGNTAETSSRIRMVVLDRTKTFPVEIKDIVEDILASLGVDAGDYDTSQITGTVDGYSASRRMPARAALQPLLALAGVDVVESDYKLVFQKKKSGYTAPVGPAIDWVDDFEVIVDEDDILDPQPGGGDDTLAVKDTVVHDRELFRIFEVVYPDIDREHFTSVQRVFRSTAVVDTDSIRVLDVPIVMTSDRAIRLADRLLIQAWAERKGHAFNLPQKYLALDCNDMVKVTYNGETFSQRVTQQAIDGTYSSHFGTIETLYDMYTALNGYSIDSSFGEWVAPAYDPVGISILFILDIPYLRDADARWADQSGIYFAVGPTTSNWGGAAILKEMEGNPLTNLGTISSAIWGVIVEDIPLSPDHIQHVTWDRSTTFQAKILYGTPASVTEEEVRNGNNTFAIGNTAEGWELFSVKDITDDGDGYYTFSTFIRGRRGTDAFMKYKRRGAFIIKLEENTVRRHQLAVADIGRSVDYRALNFGQAAYFPSTMSYALKANDLKPWAPCHVRGVREANGDITLTWKRRTRFGGETVLTATNSLIGEASEAYEVDIMSVNGGDYATVIRSFSSSDITVSSDAFTDGYSATVTYTWAQQVADNYYTQGVSDEYTSNRIVVRVYQLSSTMGRGFAREDIIKAGNTEPVETP